MCLWVCASMCAHTCVCAFHMFETSSLWNFISSALHLYIPSFARNFTRLSELNMFTTSSVRNYIYSFLKIRQNVSVITTACQTVELRNRLCQRIETVYFMFRSSGLCLRVVYGAPSSGLSRCRLVVARRLHISQCVRLEDSFNVSMISQFL